MEKENWESLSNEEFNAKLRELYGEKILQEFKENKKDEYFLSRAEMVAAVQVFNANREKQDLNNLSTDELEEILQQTIKSNQVKEEELRRRAEEARKKELIAQIREAQEVGKELDAQLSAENIRTEDERE